MQTRVKITNKTYKGRECLFLESKYERGSNIDKAIRQLPVRLYSSSCKCWYIPYRKDYKAYLTSYFGAFGRIEIDFDDMDKFAQEEQLNGVGRSDITIKIDKQKKKIYVDHGYFPELFRKLLAIGSGVWLKSYKNWMFPGNNEMYLQLISLFNSLNLQYKRIDIKHEHAKTEQMFIF